MYPEFSLLAAALLVCGEATPHPKPNAPVSRDFKRSDPYADWPSYSQLPLDPSYPTKAAWGVRGANDTLGALNHITNITIQVAAREVKLGWAFNLNLDVNQFVTPINTNRKPLTHLYQPGDGYTDDVIMLNTQISTQFDGLRHFPYSTNASVDTYQWYNNLIPSYDDVIGPAPTTVLGIQEAAQFGIAGRGVLLDWAGWAATQNITFDAFQGREITVAELDATAAWQGLPAGNWSLPGDILLIRTGWIAQYHALTELERETLPWSGIDSVGMLASDDSLEWLWDKKLAFVGADNPAFESLPFNKTINGVAMSLHQVFIGGKLFSPFIFVPLST